MVSRAELLFCWFPTVFSAAGALLSAIFGAGLVAQANIYLLLAITVLISVSAISVFLGHFQQEIENRLAWSVILLNGGLIILFFAGLHHGAGLLYTGPENDVDLSFADSLYFSIVTFTTLGYGDFQPSEEMRLVAATQALFGYLYLGLTVGSLIDLGAKAAR